MASDPLSGVIGSGKGGSKPKADKAAKAAKAPAKKAAAPAKAEGDKIVRAPSTISKEGTQKDAFTGEVLPVTAFPTVKGKDGTYVRGTVARKNLEAYRAENKKNREAAKAAKEAAKKEAAAKKAAAAKAAPAKDAAAEG